MHTQHKITLPESVTTQESIIEYTILIRYESDNRFREVLNSFKPNTRKLSYIEPITKFSKYRVSLTEEEFMVLKLSFNLVIASKFLDEQRIIQNYYVEI